MTTIGEIKARARGGKMPGDKDEVLDGDHAGLAEILVERLRWGSPEDVVFAEGWFWYYSEESGTWLKHDTGTVRRVIIGMRENVLWSETRRNVLRITRQLMGSVESIAQALVDYPGFFDNPRTGLAFRNGFAVAGPNGIRMVPHAPENFARFAYGFDYDPDAKCPKWEAFLESLFDCDDDAAEKIAFIRTFIGGALTGQSTTYARALMLIGCGSNGKSVFCDAIERLFPAESVCQVAPHAMAQPFSAIALAGAMLNLVTDIPTTELKDAGAFKQIVSGDPIAARRLHQDFVSFRPRCAHIFSANEMPMLYDYTEGFFRRWAIIPFNKNFEPGKGARTREDILADLDDELPGIMTWALQGACELMEAKHLKLPPDHFEAIKKWRYAVDQVSAFIEERCSMGPEIESVVHAKDLYQAYGDWALENGHGKMSSRRFADRMRQAGGRRVRRANGKHWIMELLPRHLPNKND